MSKYPKLTPDGWTDMSNRLRLHVIPEITEAYRKGKVTCQVSRFAHPQYGEITHLWLRRDDNRPMGWTELQRCKNTLAGPDRLAIQVFPRESDKIDQSNMYHLWVFPEGFSFEVEDCTFRF